MKHIGIIGTGTLGSRLAALIAGCGVDVTLFGRRGKPIAARTGLVRARPPALYTLSDLARIEAADIERDAGRLGECDWIVECIAENADAKRALFVQVEPHLREDAILTSATSGLTRAELAQDMPDCLRRRFFITHFFYPPRHMKLVEIIGGGEVDPSAIERVTSFLTLRTGKGIVTAKDTPNFIANRIGIHYVMDAIHAVAERGWPVEAVDTVMGRATGRPPTGIFGMADLVGIDTVAAVAGTMVSRCGHDLMIDRCRIPQYLQRMIVNGLVGDKVGQGFYRREGAKRWVLDPQRMQYRPQLTFLPRSIAESDGERDIGRRLKHIVMSDDPGGEIAWFIVSNMLVYAAHLADAIADDPAEIDRAMRWGYGWEMGPFETWDCLGVGTVCDRLARQGRAVPATIGDIVREACQSSRRDTTTRRTCSAGDRTIVFKNCAGDVVEADGDVAVLTLHRSSGVFDAACGELIEDAISQAELKWRGIIVTGDEGGIPGALNHYDLLNKARLKKWDEIDATLLRHQSLARRIRYSRRPLAIVAAGRLTGIAAELSFAAAHRHFWVESTLCLDHILLGLLPAAGGLVRLIEMQAERERISRLLEQRGENMCSDGGPHPKVKRVFELVGAAARSRSAFESKEMGLANPADGIVMDREKLVEQAVAALKLMADQYEPPEPRGIVLPGRGGMMALMNDMRSHLAMETLRAEDAEICTLLARTLTGGDYPTVHTVSEQEMLSLEREAFLTLIATPMTQIRIEHFLKTGRYLR